MSTENTPKTRRLKPQKGDPEGTIRYGAPKGGQDLTFGDEELVTAIDKHITKHIGKVDTVLHEVISTGVHLDIHVVKPTKKRPVWVLVTSGMSEMPMNAPEGAEHAAYAELAVVLPEWWKLDSESFKDEKWYWPVRWMKTLARFPHEFETWLFYDQTVDLAPVLPDTGTGFCGVIMGFNGVIPERFVKLRFRKRDIYCLMPLPIYQEEMDFKHEHGAEALTDRLDTIDIMPHIYDPDRPNTCAETKKPKAGKTKKMKKK